MRPLAILISSILLNYIGTAQAQPPQAAMEEYVWEPLQQLKNPNYFQDDCEYDSFAAYKLCLEDKLKTHDNQLSQQWGLTDRVVREKDTIYIKVPNRHKPLVFRDEQSLFNLPDNDYYSLYDYQPSQQILYLMRSYAESENMVLIDLNTGFNQEFAGIDIAVSPDGSHVANVDRYLGEENITIWRRGLSGRYEIDYEANIDELIPHLDYYNGSDRHYAEEVDINWLDDNTAQLDFYFTLNAADDMGYRVRFNVLKTSQSIWQVRPIK